MESPFSRMEESVRNMAQLKTRCDALTKEKSSIISAYEVRTILIINNFSKEVKEFST